MTRWRSPEIDVLESASARRSISAMSARVALDRSLMMTCPAAASCPPIRTAAVDNGCAFGCHSQTARIDKTTMKRRNFAPFDDMFDSNPTQEFRVRVGQEHELCRR